jgi:hypothetical protein
LASTLLYREAIRDGTADAIKTNNRNRKQIAC